jgi:Domain of unknown function (DUF1840)
MQPLGLRDNVLSGASWVVTDTPPLKPRYAQSPKAVQMIYQFKSKACGDVIMLGPHGDQLLQLLGRPPSAKGIIEAPDCAAAAARLKAAIVHAEQSGSAVPAAGQPADEDAVTLRRRLWPMIEMLTQAGAASQPVVWGV